MTDLKMKEGWSIGRKMLFAFAVGAGLAMLKVLLILVLNN